MRRDKLVPWLILGALLIGFYVVPRAAFPIGSPPEPTAEESNRIGWSEGEVAEAISEDLFERLNDERLARGLPALQWHDGLAQRAQQWSRHMIAQGDYRHSDASFQAHPDFVQTGENILMLYTGSTDAHVGWMESDGHRENILRPEFTAVGIGAVCRHDGRLWATQIFGAARQDRPHSPVDLGPDPVVRTDSGVDCPRPLFGLQRRGP